MFTGHSDSIYRNNKRSGETAHHFFTQVRRRFQPLIFVGVMRLGCSSLLYIWRTRWVLPSCFLYQCGLFYPFSPMFWMLEWKRCSILRIIIPSTIWCKWRKEDECSSDLDSLHMHCAVSCGFGSIHWSFCITSPTTLKWTFWCGPTFVCPLWITFRA